MGRPKNSIALKDGDAWSAKWPGFIHLASGRYRRPIKWRGRCTNTYYVETTCSHCGGEMLRATKHARSRFRAVCSTKCKSAQIVKDAAGNKTVKFLGIEQGHYVLVRAVDHPRASNGVVREHILVAEKMLGRRLRQGEVVHHIDFIKHHNAPENLFVCRTGKEHRDIHRSINQCIAGLLNGGRLIFDRKRRRYRVANN